MEFQNKRNYIKQFQNFQIIVIPLIKDEEYWRVNLKVKGIFRLFIMKKSLSKIKKNIKKEKIKYIKNIYDKLKTYIFITYFLLFLL